MIKITSRSNFCFVILPPIEMIERAFDKLEEFMKKN